MSPVKGRFGDWKYEIELLDQNKPAHNSRALLESGALVFVYDAGTTTLSTLYSDVARTSLTNPISRSQFATDGAIKFWSASSSHDIFVAYSDGSCGRYDGVEYIDHSLTLNRSNVDRCMIATFGSATSETDLGVDFPYGSWLYKAGIYVRTSDGSEDIDVGLLSSETNGDADGIFDAISVNATGWVDPVTFTTGSNETYFSADTYGILMGPATHMVAGSDVATDVGTFNIPGHYVTGTNAQSLSYSASAGSDTGVGEIYVHFKCLPQ